MLSKRAMSLLPSFDRGEEPCKDYKARIPLKTATAILGGRSSCLRATADLTEAECPPRA